MALAIDPIVTRLKVVGGVTAHLHMLLQFRCLGNYSALTLKPHQKQTYLFRARSFIAKHGVLLVIYDRRVALDVLGSLFIFMSGFVLNVFDKSKTSVQLSTLTMRSASTAARSLCSRAPDRPPTPPPSCRRHRPAAKAGRGVSS